MSPTTAAVDSVVTRPRVEGDREQEIFEATLDALAELGYDRLTMDSVAARAKASKATLYRRWSSKAVLVIDALMSHKELSVTPDTGSLRGDLMGAFCGSGGLTDERETAMFASVLTAVMRDAEFAEAFRRDCIAPKVTATLTIFQRARDRGEIPAGVDIELLAPALPGIVMHRLFLLGEAPTPDLIIQVIDQIILPAATRGATPPLVHHPSPAHTPDHPKDMS